MYTYKLKLGPINIFFYPTLSWVILPLFVYLYYKYIELRAILFNTLISIAIIGSYKTIQEYYLFSKEREKWQFWQYFASLITHLILLVILKDFCKYGHINKYSLILMMLGIFIIKFLPWWPYPTSSKKEFIILIFLINLILYSSNYIFCKKLLTANK